MIEITCEQPDILPSESARKTLEGHMFFELGWIAVAGYLHGSYGVELASLVGVVTGLATMLALSDTYNYVKSGVELHNWTSSRPQDADQEQEIIDITSYTVK